MKKAVIVLIGIGAIAVVLALGFVAFVKPKLGEPVQKSIDNVTDVALTKKPDKTINSTPEPTSTPADDDVSKIDTSDWKIYQNEDYGISFRYPSAWLLERDSPTDENIFGMSFIVGEIDSRLSVIGVTNKYVEEGPFGWFGYCAVAYKNVDQFCKEGCLRINDETATRRGIENHGDMGYSLLAYSNSSKKFPSICWELDMSSIIFKVAEQKDIGYYEVKDEDIEYYISENKKDESLKDIIQKFKEFSQSIKSF